MNLVLFSGALSAMLAGSSLLAQGRVWIVDAANGAGTNFTDLPPAEAAAAPGDVLLVRAGTYSAFTTSKGIAVLGVPGQTFVSSSILSMLTVSSLPAGQTFTAHGIVLAPWAGFPGLAAPMSIDNCAGVVHLQQLDAQVGPLGTEARISIRGCAFATLVACGHGGASAFGVHTDNSIVSIAGSRLTGRSAFSDPRVGQWQATEALSLAGGARVLLANTTLEGGDGASIWPHVGSYYSSSPGALIQSGHLVVANAASPYHTIAAGTGVTTTLPVSAVAGTGTLSVDPSIVLTPFAGAPPTTAGIVTVRSPVPGLTAAGATLGGSLTFTLRSSPGDPFVIAAGLTTAPIALPFGTLFLNPTTLIFLAFGTQSALGSTTGSATLPGNPSLRGLALGLQAASSAALTLTNPIVLVVR